MEKNLFKRGDVVVCRVGKGALRDKDFLAKGELYVISSYCGKTDLITVEGGYGLHRGLRFQLASVENV